MAFTSLGAAQAGVSWRFERTSVITPDGIIYVAACGTEGGGRVRLYKSTDSGASYTEVIATNHGAVDSGVSNDVASSIQIALGLDGRIHMAVYRNQSATVYYLCYNPATNTWTAHFGMIYGSYPYPHSILIDAFGGLHIWISNNLVGGYTRHSYIANATPTSLSSFTHNEMRMYEVRNVMPVALPNGDVHVVFNNSGTGRLEAINWTKSTEQWGTNIVLKDNFGNVQGRSEFISVFYNPVKSVIELFCEEQGDNIKWIFEYNPADGANVKTYNNVIAIGQTIGGAYFYHEEVTDKLYLFWIDISQTTEYVRYISKSLGADWTLGNGGTIVDQADDLNGYMSMPAKGDIVNVPFFAQKSNVTYYSKLDAVHAKIKYRTLKFQGPGGAVSIPVYPPTTTPMSNTNLRIKVDATHPYCIIELVDVTHLRASALRINTNTGIKALRK